MEISDSITLFTSDARPKYINDVLSVIGLPSGSQYQFRYETKYVPSAIRDFFENKSVQGTKVLIAFKSLNSLNENDTFIVPIRWATLNKVSRLTDFYVLKFTVNSYPEFSNDISNCTLDEIIKKSNELILNLPQECKKLPVVPGLISMVDPKQSEDENSWLMIAKALSRNKTFEYTHFLRVSKLRNETNNSVDNNPLGQFQVSDGKYFSVKIDYFAENFSNRRSAFLKVQTIPTFIQCSCNSTIILDSRYDSLTIWFYALTLPGDGFTEIEIYTTSSENEPSPLIKIPIEVIKSKNLSLLRFLTSTIGGILIAMPGIVKDLSTPLNIMFASVGALIIAAGVNFIYPRRS